LSPLLSDQLADERDVQLDRNLGQLKAQKHARCKPIWSRLPKAHIWV
jgi:hypothetical protein